MSFDQIVNVFIEDIKKTGWIEFIAVFSGIASVWYSRKENILVYPTGLLNTTFYIYLSFKGGLFGEASVNFYYTVMSIYGWILWSKKDAGHHIILKITKANRKEWTQHLTFFASFYIVIFFALTALKKSFSDSVIPWADAFASATAFTGMWLMAKKKVESWYWWIATNIASIPLYFVKHYVFTSVYYVILLIMAIFGLMAWLKKTNDKQTITDEPGTHLGLSS
ncbi:MAG: nicotinamide riboside transporter PnuC [Ferruginibacter sp.]